MPQSLQERINSFVGWLFEGFETATPRDSKVINDALLGNQYFTRAEIAVIDSPLLQRLKKIKQTGLVYQVFPSATHSRFEHCLGVCTLAERSFKAIHDRFLLEHPSKPFPAKPERDLPHLRMAALLHDVGHGLCSHASEQIYETLTDIQEFKKEPDFANNAVGEILSHLIVKSEVFQGWFQKYVVGECGAKIDLSEVASMILGNHPESEKHFLAQIVSSPYDADKLDYIARDSLYCGLALTVDLPRFYSIIATAPYQDRQCLALRNYVPLEQILFSKMTLYGSVYHHPKVKCLDAMLGSLIRHIVENADQCGVPVRDRTVGFADPVEYLYVTDEEFFNQFENFGDEFVKKMLSRFRQRDLFVRCIEMSRRTVVNWDDPNRKNLVDLSAPRRTLKQVGERDLERRAPLNIHDVETEIHKRLPTDVRTKCNLGEVLLSVPTLPKMTGDFAYIQTSRDAVMDPIDDFFPLPAWTLAYAHNKWRSFVYAPRQFAPAVRDAAIPLMRELLGLEINVAKSNQACHLT